MRPLLLLCAGFTTFIVNLVDSEAVCGLSLRPQAEVKANWNSGVPEDWKRAGDFRECRLELYHHYDFREKWHTVSGSQGTLSLRQLSNITQAKRIRSLRVVGNEDCQIAIRVNKKCMGRREGYKRSIVIRGGSMCKEKQFGVKPHCMGRVLLLYRASWNSTWSPPDKTTTTSEIAISSPSSPDASKTPDPVSDSTVPSVDKVDLQSMPQISAASQQPCELASIVYALPLLPAVLRQIL